jgi:sigma-54 dependent transcriptional regulator, acetoin dehydrogenase operon transcriptional activator AcoR
VLAALEAYPWPGNVRELLNVLEGELSVLRDGGDVLSRIPPALQQRRVAPPAARPALGPAVSAAASAGGRAEKQLRLEELERRACEESLAAHRGNVARAARALGVAKSTLYVKMKRYGLVPSGGTSDDPPRPLAAVTSE